MKIKTLFFLAAIFLIQSGSLIAQEPRAFKKLEEFSFQSQSGARPADAKAQYFIIDNPLEHRVLISLRNMTSIPFSIENAVCYAITQDQKSYLLEWDKIEFNEGVPNSFIVNPEQTITFFTKSPISPQTKFISAILIRLEDSQEIKLNYIPKQTPVFYRNQKQETYSTPPPPAAPINTDSVLSGLFQQLISQGTNAAIKDD